MELKQPILGTVATAIGICIALGFISRFDFPTFAGWISYYLLCVIPVQIILAITLGTKHPDFASRRTQPARGILLVLIALAVGGIIAAVVFETIGGGISPPTPNLVMYAIVAVVTTFWAAIMMGGWPASILGKNPLATGLGVLLTSEIACYLVYKICFDFGFLRGAPFYVAALDPHGLFNAWKALVFCVTIVAAMFMIVGFDLWPLTLFPSVMRQPLLGVLWTLLAVVLVSIAFYIGVGVMGMDAVAFLVRVPVPFIFGSIIILNMFQGTFFKNLKQPTKGVAHAISAAAVGLLLTLLYAALIPMVTGTLRSGPPGYDFEIWLASALLAVTFPFLIFIAEFFKLWPFQRT